MRKEFERVSPESLGISSKGILKLLDALEGDFTEMHGIMIMRDESIAAEGWWTPYAPGLHHMCNSLTKTYMGTAIGAAVTEGLLSLDDRIYDIFPEYKPEHPTEFQDNLTIRNVLRFSTGMTKFPEMEGNWVKNFINLDLTYMPGTTFFYNSVASTFLGKVIERVTGKNVYTWLAEKVFCKIGIDADNLDHGIAPDGYDMWAWRTVSTTEDNLRLMKLYRDGGVVNGERILSEEYVKLATCAETDNSSHGAGRNDIPDSHAGYGFQMWMCSYPGAYRADGAAGQFSIVIPDKNMIISINENAAVTQKVLTAIWENLMPEVYDSPLPEDEEALTKLRYRLSHLAIKAPVFQPYSDVKAAFGGCWHAADGETDLYCRGMNAQESVPGIVKKNISDLSLNFSNMALKLEMRYEDNTHEKLIFAMDGTRRMNLLYTAWEFASECYCNAYFEDNSLNIELLWPENNSRRKLTMAVNNDKMEMSENIAGGPHSAPHVNTVVFTKAELH